MILVMAGAAGPRIKITLSDSSTVEVECQHVCSTLCTWYYLQKSDCEHHGLVTATASQSSTESTEILGYAVVVAAVLIP
jgi:hypothetical protein